MIGIPHQSLALMLLVRSLVAARRPMARIGAIGYALPHRRALRAIPICSILSLASLGLAAALVQAQESSGDKSVAQRPQAQMVRTEARHLVLGMVDRNDLEPFPNSGPQAGNPFTVGVHGVERVLLPSDSLGAEFASLAALASTPSPSLL